MIVPFQRHALSICLADAVAALTKAEAVAHKDMQDRKALASRAYARHAAELTVASRGWWETTQAEAARATLFWGNVRRQLRDTVRLQQILASRLDVPSDTPVEGAALEDIKGDAMLGGDLPEQVIDLTEYTIHHRTPGNGAA